MTKLKLTLSVLVLLALSSSCSKATKSTAQLEISLGALVGVTFSGGALVGAENMTTGEIKMFELVPPYNVTIPYGKWSLYVVGFEGSKTWQGPHACGALLDYNFLQDNQTVSIKVASGNCGVEPYTSMIATRAGKWDIALWDQANWN